MGHLYMSQVSSHEFPARYSSKSYADPLVSLSSAHDCSRTNLAAHVERGCADARGEQHGSEEVLEMHLDQLTANKQSKLGLV